MSDDRAPITVELGLSRVEIDPVRACIHFHDGTGTPCLLFKLIPDISLADKSHIVLPPLSCTARTGDGLEFETSVPDMTVRVALSIRKDSIELSSEIVPRTPLPELGTVCFGRAGMDFGTASPHRLEEFYTLTAARFGSAIPRKAYTNFKCGSIAFNFSKDNCFPHDGGRTIIPPYCAALKASDIWLGIGVLEIPDSEYGLSMCFQDGKCYLEFDYGSSIPLTSSYRLPHLTFYTAENKTAAVKKYLDRVRDEGLSRSTGTWDKSWAGPIFCFFSDQMYETELKRPTLSAGGEDLMARYFCNETFLNKCLQRFEEKNIDYGIVIIDYGWFVGHGDLRPDTTRFPDFKATIKQLQEKGKKVLLWVDTNLYSEDSELVREHPEGLCRNKDGSLYARQRFTGETVYHADYTHPAARKVLAKNLRYLLSPEGLDADGIKVDGTIRRPSVHLLYHDPSWGIGERYQYAMFKFIYDTCKAVKPLSIVNNTCGNPFFNDTTDLHRIHDGLEYNLHDYEERAWSAWLCGCGMLDLDDWPSYDVFTVRANLRKICYGVPSIYSVRYRGHQRTIGWSSTGYSVSVDDDEYELLSTLYRMYTAVPVSGDQEFFIEPFRKIFWRKYTAGPLKGFFAARTLAGNTAAAVYGQKEALVASLTDMPLSMPLPRGAEEVSVAAVSRTTGAMSPVAFEHCDDGILFRALRCSGELLWYRIGYSIAAD